MRSKTRKLLMAWFIVFALAPAAMAGFLGPFSFTFANSGLNAIFLFPFRFGGCF